VSFYANLAVTVRRLLAQFGADATLTRTTTGAYNPVTGTASQTTTAYNCQAVRDDYALREVDGTMIKAGDRRFYISVQDMVMPQPADTITFGGRTYVVVTALSIDPALTAVLYDVQARWV